jgi:hypothetical protein
MQEILADRNAVDRQLLVYTLSDSDTNSNGISVLDRNGNNGISKNGAKRQHFFNLKGLFRYHFVKYCLKVLPREENMSKNGILLLQEGKNQNSTALLHIFNYQLVF